MTEYAVNAEQVNKVESTSYLKELNDMYESICSAEYMSDLTKMDKRLCEIMDTIKMRSGDITVELNLWLTVYDELKRVLKKIEKNKKKKKLIQNTINLPDWDTTDVKRKSGVVCSICLHKHTFGESVLTDCDHLFGRSCFGKWYKVNKTCPMCREYVDAVYLFRKY